MLHNTSKSAEKPTKVIFLVHPATGDLFAYFPNDKYASNGYRNDNRTCYAHVGQHSACAPEYAKESRKATPEEYADLKKELEQIGYNLKIV